MAWNNFFRRLTQRSNRSASSNRNRRRLSLESLTKRELLASDLGAVSGTAFIDNDTSGGFTAGDTALSNVAVEIFEDTNNNNQFDAGTDLSAGTDTTDTNGVYRFDGLSPGTHFVQQANVAGATGPGVVMVEVVDDGGQRVQLIDNYIGTVTNVSAGPAPSMNEQGSFPAAEALGGHRDVVVNVDQTNAENGSVQALFNGTGELLLNAGGDAGSVLIQYDGADNATTLNETGLGGISLAGGAATEAPVENSGLILRLRSENAANDMAQIRVFTSPTQMSSFNVVIPANVTIQEVFVPFANFTGNADFNNVGAIEAEVGLSLDNDVRVQIVETIQPVVVAQNLVNTPPQIDLTISKTLNAAESNLQAGGVAVFDIRVDNLGPDDATGVAVQDIIPAGLTFSAADSDFGTFADNITGSTLDVVIGNLASGANATFQLGTTIDGNVLADITNNATVSGNEIETDTTNNDDDELVDLTFADLVITKVDATDPVNAGDQEVYTITVTNTGPDSATNVVITDTLPTDVTFVSGSNPRGTVTLDNTSGDLNIPIGTLANNESVQVTVTVDVSESATSPLNNTARVIADPNNDTDMTNNETTEPTVVNRVVDLEIDKIVSGTPIAGENVTYTIVVDNNGPGEARNVTVSDVLDTDLTFVSYDPLTSGVPTPTQAGQNLGFNIGTLASGASRTFSFVASIASSASGVIPNSATVTTSDTESDNTNNTDAVDINVSNVTDLVLTKSVDQATAIAGQTQLTYTFTVSHDAGSSSDANNVVITDVLPAGLSNGNIIAATATSQNFNSATNTATISFDTIPVGQTRTFTITADVDEDVTGTITNPATLTANNDDDDTNNSDSADTVVNPQFDVTLTKVVNDETPSQGDTITYTIGISNSGPSTATNVLLTDDIPAGLTFSSGSLNGQAATSNGTTVTFPAITLASGATSNAQLLFTVDATASGTIQNVATVTADNETVTNNNQANEDITVTPQVDVRVEKSVDQANAQVGDTLVYSVTVTNDGPNTAQSVVATDTLPSGVTFVSGTGPNGALSASNSQVIVNGGDLASGGSFSFTINATINAGTTTRQTNNVSVATATTETDLTNNNASAFTDVDPVTSSIAGTVYVDANNNGAQDAGEVGIAGVTLELTGTVQGVAIAAQTVTTDANGNYVFDNLAAGEYTVTETQPAAFRDGTESPGQNATANTGDDVFTQIGLGADTDAINFDFGELEAIETLSKRRFLASS